MKKVVIDRARWWNGRYAKHTETFGVSHMLNFEGLMCCLGFAVNQVKKLSLEELQGEPSPEDVYRNRYDLRRKKSDIFCVAGVDEFADTDFSHAAMVVNDSAWLPDSDRERVLRVLFKSADLNLVFEGEYPPVDSGK